MTTTCPDCDHPRTGHSRRGLRRAGLPVHQDLHGSQSEEEVMGMPTVPNWIPRAVVYVDPPGINGGEFYPIKSWRATNTQVIVTYTGSYDVLAEVRFRLDDLRQIGRTRDRISLLDPSAPGVSRMIDAVSRRRAVDDLRSAVAVNRLDHQDVENLLASATAIHDAAAKAMAALGQALP